MNKKENGFGVVELILILVILGIIGFTGWRVYEVNRESGQISVDNSSVEEHPSNTVPDGYKEYVNAEYKLSFVYPEGWLVQPNRAEDEEAGVIVTVASPEVDKIYKDAMAAALAKDAPPRSDVVVSRWENINNVYAKGGYYEGERQYTSLDDYFNDSQYQRLKQKIGPIVIKGQEASEVIIGGMGSSYGIMFDRQDGIYQIEFPAIYEKKDLTSEARQIINSFKFN